MTQRLDQWTYRGMLAEWDELREVWWVQGSIGRIPVTDELMLDQVIENHGKIHPRQIASERRP